MTNDETDSHVDTRAEHSRSEARARRPARIRFHPLKSSRRLLVVLCVVTFLVACGVRWLTLEDSTLEIGKVQSAVTGDYKHVARLLLAGGVASFFSPASPLANPDTLGHPPGYSIFIAFVFRLGGESDRALQLIQIVCDAAATVVILLIVAELLPIGVAFLAALCAAFAPQFVWNSVVVLPDTLAVLPLLLAVYCIVRAWRRPRLAWLLAAGALIGLSCWLRANAMLLAPFLAVVLVPFLFERGRRLGYAAALVGGMLVVVAPLTIRNAMVFGRFIPLSLGAGQTLLEGIADYDHEGRFGIPATDLGIMRMEARLYGRPEFAETLFGEDGVARERMRLRRGWEVISAHPVWFAGVMLRRAAGMLKLERARLVTAQPPVAHTHGVADGARPVWSNNAIALKDVGTALAGGTVITLAPDAATLSLKGDASRYGKQFATAPFDVKRNTDYLLKLPVKIERGRVSIAVDSDVRVASLASTIVDASEGKSPDEQPVVVVAIPFVGMETERVRVVFSNAAPDSVARLGEISLYELGAARGMWTRYPRAVVRSVQRIFLTAFMLPLAVVGFVLLLRARHGRTLVALLAVPAYFLSVQSILHTEYRYVLVIHYFLFTLAATALYWAAKMLSHHFRFHSNATEADRPA
ncbi:MAG TPA: glycosyltransferase family 39 protein [Pyrinomonadaceae bacterium]|jgi:hypothetical protein